MNRGLSLIGVLLLCVSVPLASGHAASSSRLEQANASLRPELAKAMLEGAVPHGIQILSDGIVFASRDDGMVANTGVAGFDSITPDSLARGTVVGLTYISGFGVAPGFYRTYVLLSKGAKEGTAYLFDEAGRTVKTGTVTPGSPAAARQFTLGVTEGGCTLDFHNRWLSISITINK